MSEVCIDYVDLNSLMRKRKRICTERKAFQVIWKRENPQETVPGCTPGLSVGIWRTYPSTVILPAIRKKDFWNWLLKGCPWLQRTVLISWIMTMTMQAKGKGFRTATARISDSAYIFHHGYGYQKTWKAVSVLTVRKHITRLPYHLHSSHRKLKKLFRPENYPERFSKWFEKFVEHVTYNL